MSEFGRGEMPQRVYDPVPGRPRSLEPDAEWEEAWANEADRREAEVDSGKAALLPGDEVIARLRVELS